MKKKSLSNSLRWFYDFWKALKHSIDVTCKSIKFLSLTPTKEHDEDEFQISAHLSTSSSSRLRWCKWKHKIGAKIACRCVLKFYFWNFKYPSSFKLMWMRRLVDEIFNFLMEWKHFPKTWSVLESFSTGSWANLIPPEKLFKIHKISFNDKRSGASCCCSLTR